MNKPEISLEITLGEIERAKKRGDYQRVKGLLRYSLENFPNFQQGYINLTDILLQEWNLEEARQVLIKAQDIFANSQEIAKQILILLEREKQQAALSKSNKILSVLKDKHKRERCTIVGKDANTSEMDLSFLREEICFGLNGSERWFEKWCFVPNYYVAIDSQAIAESADILLHLPCTKFLSVTEVDYLTIESLIFIDTINCRDYFSIEATQGVNSGEGNAMYVAMQLAYYMGFTSVVAIGLDSELKLGENSDREKNSQRLDLGRAESYYKLADVYFRADDRQIIDATLEGSCPVFEKRDYRELFFSKTGNLKASDILDLQKAWPLSIPVNEICAWAYQYEQDPTNRSALDKLASVRQPIANMWLTSSAEQLPKAYAGDLGRVYQALLDINIQNEPPADREGDFIRDLVAEIAKGFDSPTAIQNLLAVMPYLYPHQLFITFDFGCITKWFFNDYVNFLLSWPSIFQEIGESDRYYLYLQKLLDKLQGNIFNNGESQFWQDVAWKIVEKIKLIPLYFQDNNCITICQQRASLIEFCLKSTQSEIDWFFAKRSPKQKKIRLGILIRNFWPTAESFATLPVYKYLNRDLFEIFLFALEKTNHRFENYCAGHADALVELPSGYLPNQVKTIRDAELDILFIATNITAISNFITQLAMHRLAPVQMVNANSPVTTGMRHIDYYISSKLSEPENDAQQHYTETVTLLDGPPQCFDFGTEEQLLPTIRISPDKLGIPESAVVYISGANFYKITPEVEAAWIKILASVPNSLLLLYPFNPNWSTSYPVTAFRNRVAAALAKSRLSGEQLIFLDPVPNRADIKEYLKLGDIYLDAYPYSGMTSLVDPLELGLPTVVMTGESSRSQKGASLLRSLQIVELIASSEAAYIQLAVELGTNSDLRRAYSDRIREKMQNNPAFLDVRSYCAQMGALFQKLFRERLAEELTEDFRLRDINLIVFPDWSQSEESLYQNLTMAIHNLATHPDRDRITLLIDTSNISEEDANLMLSGAVMNLMMEEDLDVSDGPELSLVGELSDIQWSALRPRLQARIVLENENKEAVAAAKAKNFPSFNLKS